MALARADLESLLRARNLDRTLTSALPPLDPDDDQAVGATGLTALDARLGGGFPRGQLSELVGPRSSGRTSVLLAALAAATGRGELSALVDALDMFDVESALAAGVDLDRLLWIRGQVVANPGLCRDTNQRALEQAIRALTLVLQAGQLRRRRVRRRRRAARRDPAAAVHDVAAPAADGRGEPDGVRAGREPSRWRAARLGSRWN